VKIYDFGLRLKKLREEKGLSQEEVASRLNFKKSTISGYERNVTTPSLEALKSMAIFYNVSTDYLLGLTDRAYIYLDGFSEDDKQSVAQIVEQIREMTKNRLM